MNEKEQEEFFKKLGLVRNPQFNQPGYAEWLLLDSQDRIAATFTTRLAETPELAATHLLQTMYSHGYFACQRGKPVPHFC